MKTLVFLLALASSATAQTLVGRAVLPADTFVPGPTSGQWIEPANGRTPPWTGKQPVQGFSSLKMAPGGDFWVLPDNGFGTKANSADFMLCLYKLGRDLQTAKGGEGLLFVKSRIALRDPNHKVAFPIVADHSTLTLPKGGEVSVDPEVRQGRLLTGADFDPESLVVEADGSFWISDEIGPFLLHFDSSGVLLEAPYALDGVASPGDPLGRPANIARSKGFEGLAQQGNFLYAMLEGALSTEQDQRRLRIFEFDLTTKRWTGRRFSYRLEEPDPSGKQHSVSELAALPNGHFLATERDSGEGDKAKFKHVYSFDLKKTDASGDVVKHLALDLLNISDPTRLTGNAVFRFPFQCPESVLALGPRRLAFINDNNYPFGAGRRAGESENTELIIVDLPESP